MKKILFILAICLIATTLSFADNSQKIEQMMVQAPYVDQEIIIKYKDSKVRVASMMSNIGVLSAKKIGVKKQFSKVKISGDMKATLKKILANPNVAYAEPNYIVHTFDKKSNDPSYNQLWGMDKIKAPKGWEVRTNARPVIVAVIDTGVDYTHSDLADNMWVNEAERDGIPGVDDDGNGYVDDIHGWNAEADNGDPLDDHSHGSHCAGTIAGVGNNGQGIVGVCWQAKIMACKFLSASGSGSTADAIECIDYAVANGAKVLSNSWGGGGYSQALYDSIRAAGDAGVFFVAAAGNDYGSNLSYPAKYCEDGLTNVLAVAATDSSDNKASFSQYSTTSNDAGNLIAAPGVDIYSTVIGNSYDTYSGTSMATPHVAGVATLVLAEHPQLDPVALKNRLVQSGDTVSWWFPSMDVQRLNLNNALRTNVEISADRKLEKHPIRAGKLFGKYFVYSIIPVNNLTIVSFEAQADGLLTLGFNKKEIFKQAIIKGQTYNLNKNLKVPNKNGYYCLQGSFKPADKSTKAKSILTGKLVIQK